MRLRDKNGVSPGTVHADHESIYASREMYVEPLKGQYILCCTFYDASLMLVHVYINYIVSGPETKRNYGQTQVYVIRWHPSQCSVDPKEEIILDHTDPKHAVEKVRVLFEIIIVIIENMYQYGIILFLYSCQS